MNDEMKEEIVELLYRAAFAIANPDVMADEKVLSFEEIVDKYFKILGENQ